MSCPACGSAGQPTPYHILHSCAALADIRPRLSTSLLEAIDTIVTLLAQAQGKAVAQLPKAEACHALLVARVPPSTATTGSDAAALQWRALATRVLLVAPWTQAMARTAASPDPLALAMGALMDSTSVPGHLRTDLANFWVRYAGRTVYEMGVMWGKAARSPLPQGGP